MSRRLLNGMEVVQMDEEWVAKAKKKHGMFKHGMVRIMPGGYFYGGRAPYFLDKIYNFKYRPDDVIVLTFPKCGTTWMQEIVWNMIYNPNLDNPQAKTPILLRSPDMSQDMQFDGEEVDGMEVPEFEALFRKMVPDKDPRDGMMLEIIDRMEGRRVIKTHYPLCLMTPGLLDKTKVIYVVRNPKDALISYYHFARVLKLFRFTGTLEEFIEDCMKGEVVFMPFWPHVKEAWNQRHHPNMLFVFYEDMKADIMKELRRVNNFIGTNLTEQQIENVAKFTSLSAMKSRGDPLDLRNYKKDLMEGNTVFVRKGQVGDWKNVFSPELDAKVNKWIEENTKDTDITFNYGH